MDLLIPLAQAASGVTDTGVTDAGKAIALGVGAGLGSIGAGHLRAEPPCDERHAAHPGPSDRDEVEAAAPHRLSHHVPP